MQIALKKPLTNPKNHAAHSGVGACPEYRIAHHSTTPSLLVFPVDLRGPNRSIVKAALVAEAIDPTSTAFWQKVKPDLNDPNTVFDPSTPVVDTTIVNSLDFLAYPDGIHIIDEHGNFFDFADYPNKLVSGQPTDWMNDAEGDPIEGYAVTIRATLKYTRNIPLATLPAAAHKVDKHVVERRLRKRESRPADIHQRM